ncbi:MAG: hypothetical protein GY821_13835 [Gammaproteobacteria bacterium]|nr:hypothetical protein [Gammaproteobacteria bacterium]
MKLSSTIKKLLLAVSFSSIAVCGIATATNYGAGGCDADANGVPYLALTVQLQNNTDASLGSVVLNSNTQYGGQNLCTYTGVTLPVGSASSAIGRVATAQGELPSWHYFPGDSWSADYSINSTRIFTVTYGEIAGGGTVAVSNKATSVNLNGQQCNISFSGAGVGSTETQNNTTGESTSTLNMIVNSCS